MNTNIGYLLIAGGIVAIIFATTSVVMVLTGNAEPIQFYSPNQLDFDISSLMPTYNIPGMVGRTTTKQPSNAISPEMLALSFNLFIHLFLMGFLVNAGAKIATIGTQLVRPIVVKVQKHEQVISTDSSRIKRGKNLTA
jgi:hypothetical protein